MRTAISGKAKTSKPNYSAPALEKGLDIIELLAEREEGLSQGEIASSLNRSVSEIFRMLTVLVQRGYITLNPDNDRYHLSLKLFAISHRNPPTKRLVQAALPLLSRVSNETDQSCHLAVSHNEAILVIAQVDNPGSLGFSSRMGSQLDILKTASGMVMLAFQPEDIRTKMLNTYKSATGAQFKLATLERKLDEIRKRGYEEAASQQVQSITNVSFPVIDFFGRAMCAITVPFLCRLDRDNETALQETRVELRQAAIDLSSAIGALDLSVYRELATPIPKTGNPKSSKHVSAGQL